MYKKRALTVPRVVQAYWPYILRLCEEVFLDIGNLAASQGSLESADRLDSAACEQFRSKWSGVFRGWFEFDDIALHDLHNLMRKALLDEDATALQELAIDLASFPSLRHSSRKSLRLSWVDDDSEPSRLFPRPYPDGFGVPLAVLAGPRVRTWNAPILFDLPRALAAAILSFAGHGRNVVCCRQCGRCTRGRSNQRFCPGGKCRRTWHQRQPEYREKRRAYMRVKMREYRAPLISRRAFEKNHIERGKHAKATKA